MNFTCGLSFGLISIQKLINGGIRTTNTIDRSPFVANLTACHGRGSILDWVIISDRRIWCLAGGWERERERDAHEIVFAQGC